MNSAHKRSGPSKDKPLVIKTGPKIQSTPVLVVNPIKMPQLSKTAKMDSADLTEDESCCMDDSDA